MRRRPESSGASAPQRLVHFVADRWSPCTAASTLATGNLIAQGASGFFGFAANLFVDAAAVPFYAQLWNEVRGIYGKGEITAEATRAYLKPNLGFLAQDLLWDKIVGSIPIIGVPFNIAFAKALTWRLGAWFGFLSAIDGEDDVEAPRPRWSWSARSFPPRAACS